MSKNDNYVYFDVQGAGKIQIGKKPGAITGNAEGFSFGVEWGSNGYIGGVLDKKEAIKLAIHILKEVNQLRDVNLEILGL